MFGLRFSFAVGFADNSAKLFFWRDQAPLLSLSGCSSPSLHFQVKIAPRDRFLDLGVSRVARRMYSRWNLARKLERFYEHGRCAQRFYSPALVGINQLETRPKVHYNRHILCGLHDVSYQVHPHRSFRSVEDPFSLVADELSLIAKNLREQVAEEIHKKAPKLASAAKYFFERAEGKKFRPTVLLLMASALNMPISQSTAEGVFNTLSEGLRARQQSVAKITEMIHVASLLHDDVLDDADKRRGVESLNFIMGNKLAVLAGDFLLSKACVALADLKNTEVVGLLAKVVENLVTGETMQMATTSEQRRSMEYYMEKTYCKTASLISNSCKSVAILAGQTAEVSMLAYEYGRNLGLAYQLTDDILDFTGNKDVLGKGVLSDIRHGIVTAPILYAMEEFPQLVQVVDRGFDDPADVDLALEYLGKSRGIEKARQLAEEHANRAKEAIEALPDSDDEDVLRSRSALIDLTDRAIRRTK